MTRTTINQASLEAWIRREFTSRARRALRIYTRTPLVRDQAGYPFAQRPEDSSVRSAKAQSIRRIPGGVRIQVQSRGAPFLEAGNDSRGSSIEGRLALPLKGNARGARRARGRGGKSGRVFIDPNTGRAFLMVQRVSTYRGRRQLERAVIQAFGVRSIRRP